MPLPGFPSPSHHFGSSVSMPSRILAAQADPLPKSLDPRFAIWKEQSIVEPIAKPPKKSRKAPSYSGPTRGECSDLPALTAILGDSTPPSSQKLNRRRRRPRVVQHSMPDTIICPKCKATIEISEALSVPAPRRSPQAIRRQSSASAISSSRHASRNSPEEAALQSSKNPSIASGHARGCRRTKLQAEAEKKAKEDAALELRDNQAQVAELKAKLNRPRRRIGRPEEGSRARRPEAGAGTRHDSPSRRRAAEGPGGRQTRAAEERQLKEAEKEKLVMI